MGFRDKGKSMSNRIKYVIMDENKLTLSPELVLKQVRAVINFGNVQAGSLGGFIESSNNLPHDDDSWIGPETALYGDMKPTRPYKQPQSSVQASYQVQPDPINVNRPNNSNKIKIGDVEITLTSDQLKQLNDSTHYNVGDVLVLYNHKKRTINIFKAEKSGKLKDNMLKADQKQMDQLNSFIVSNALEPDNENN